MSSGPMPIFNQNNVPQRTGGDGGGLPSALPIFNQGSFTGAGAALGSAAPGSNQFVGANPATASTPGNTPGIVPPATVPPIPPVNQKGQDIQSSNKHNLPGTSTKLGGSNVTIPTNDPQFTQQFYQWLSQQLGQGVTPFNLSTLLPSTGQATAPGTLNAPLNPIEASLANFYETGQGGPMAGVLPMWNAAIAAFNGPQGPAAIADAQLRQQFGFAGDLSSSPFAQAVTQEKEQNILNEEALLTSATQQALPTMADFGGQLQSMDQNAINNMLQEFIRTQPQYSPLLNMLFGGATSSPGAIGKTSGVGALGAALSGAGSIASGVGDIVDAAKNSGSDTSAA